MRPSISGKILLIFSILALTSIVLSANENTYKDARELQREAKYDQAIEAYKIYLTSPIDGKLNERELSIYTDALVQLMNAFQSIGDPESCILTLKEVYAESTALQTYCLRDYYSVMGYALSRTENMKEAETIMLKALTLPLHYATPARYFRDYAYAAAVFYSNPKYQDEVMEWLLEAMTQAEISDNPSGKQWVTSMLGSLYKRTGDFNKALTLYLQSMKEAQIRNDYWGLLNSLNTLVDIFLYWNVPQYADIYANQAIQVEQSLKSSNPTISAQAYINKGRALHQLGKTDSIEFYLSHARNLCKTLPYNSGMVDINLLNGTYLTEKGGDSLSSGIDELMAVATQGTAANRAKAYHQLAQTYLMQEDGKKAETMLDSLSALLDQNISPTSILCLDYKPILDYYKRVKNPSKVDQYVQLMLKERKDYSQKRQDSYLVEAIVNLQTEKSTQEQQILKLRQKHQRLWTIFSIIVSAIIISCTLILLLQEKKRHKKEITKANIQLNELTDNLNQSNIEKEKVVEKMNEFLQDKHKRQEWVTLTPHILKESGELKFRESFEMLYPHFLHRLREKVPAVSHREELLSMLIALKQDNRKIAELMAIEPRSVLMLRHRFRQKIGMTTEISLENFIEAFLD